MGSHDGISHERPVRGVTVAGFWIDRHPVTNAQFSRFIAATSYVTVAERAPDPSLYPGAPLQHLVAGSMVFTPPIGPVDLRDSTRWWSWTPGANWRHPYGPQSSLAGLADHPVVHVALPDAEAFCAWAGTVLPTEAEWEYAARGGLDSATFPWGNDERPGGEFMANTWQGHFPWQNTAEDGFERTSPVGNFPANGYGLLDMVGNVWEWTADWYGVPEPAAAAPAVPVSARQQELAAGPEPTPFRVPRKVVKGGSHLGPPGPWCSYRPAARGPQEIDVGMSDLGFRTVRRPP